MRTWWGLWERFLETGRRRLDKVARMLLLLMVWRLLDDGGSSWKGRRVGVGGVNRGKPCPVALAYKWTHSRFPE
jgi:hypothetical protein